MNKVMNLEAVDFTGDTEKDGVVVTCKSGFTYYHASGDKNLKTIMVEKDYTRAKNGKTRVKMSKVFEPVTVANNQITVIVYPDGKLEVIPNTK